MESTGVYWIPVWNVLEEENFKLCLVNPAHFKNVPGRKPDVKDAEWLAKLISNGTLQPSFIPPPPQRKLHLVTYNDLQAKLARLEQKIEDMRRPTTRLSHGGHASTGAEAVALADSWREIARPVVRRAVPMQVPPAGRQRRPGGPVPSTAGKHPAFGADGYILPRRLERVAFAFDLSAVDSLLATSDVARLRPAMRNRPAAPAALRM